MTGRLHWRALVACGVLGSFATGCSLAFVEPPRAEARRSGQALSCSTGTLAPVADVGIAASQVIWILLAANGSDEDYRDARLSRPAVMTLGTVFSVIALSSAIYGFKATSACRAARAEAAQTRADASQ